MAIKPSYTTPWETISLRSLQHGFRKFLGTSISCFERDLRLQRARDELSAGGVTVADAVRTWGFSNAHRFSKLFEAKFGFMPSRYRA